MNYAEMKRNEQIFPPWRVEEMATVKRGLCDVFWPDTGDDKRVDLVVLPCDDPIGGKLGYTLFNGQDGSDLQAVIQVRYAAPAEPIFHNTGDGFNRAFSEAWDSGKTMYLCDDPVKRLCGFIVEGREYRRWHHINESDLREMP